MESLVLIHNPRDRRCVIRALNKWGLVSQSMDSRDDSFDFGTINPELIVVDLDFIDYFPEDCRPLSLRRRFPNAVVVGVASLDSLSRSETFDRSIDALSLGLSNLVSRTGVLRGNYQEIYELVYDWHITQQRDRMLDSNLSGDVRASNEIFAEAMDFYLHQKSARAELKELRQWQLLYCDSRFVLQALACELERLEQTDEAFGIYRDLFFLDRTFATFAPPFRLCRQEYLAQGQKSKYYDFVSRFPKAQAHLLDPFYRELKLWLAHTASSVSEAKEVLKDLKSCPQHFDYIEREVESLMMKLWLTIRVRRRRGDPFPQELVDTFVESLEIFLDRFPSHHVALKALFEESKQLGFRADLWKRFLAARDRLPRSPQFYNLYAQFCLEQGDLKEAGLAIRRGQIVAEDASLFEPLKKQWHAVYSSRAR